MTSRIVDTATPLGNSKRERWFGRKLQQCTHILSDDFSKIGKLGTLVGLRPQECGRSLRSRAPFHRSCLVFSIVCGFKYMVVFVILEPAEYYSSNVLNV